MKKLFTVWGELSSELSRSQKIALQSVVGTGAFILIGFLVLMVLMVHRGKVALHTNGISETTESFVFPKGAEIKSIFTDGKENFVFKVDNDKKEYLYIFTLGQKEPQRIVTIDYK